LVGGLLTHLDSESAVAGLCSLEQAAHV
jgi:hypothetical protein